MDRAVLDAYGWTELQPTCEATISFKLKATHNVLRSASETEILQRFALARRLPVAIGFVGASEQIRFARPIPLELLAKPLKPLPALL